MPCSGHVATQHALVRHCVECGQQIARKSESIGTRLPAAHHPATLTSYLGVVFAISNDGNLLCLDSELQPLISPAVQIGDEVPNLYPGDGYLYMATSSGVQCLDLITLLQAQSFNNVILTADGPAGPVTTLGDSAFCVISADACRLIGWTRQQRTLDVPLPGLRIKSATLDTLIAPSITTEYAFIAQRDDDKVLVIDRQKKKPPVRSACNGTIVFGVPSTKGMALLVESAEGRKLVSLNDSRPPAVIASLDRDISWIAEAAESRYLWGDGGRCFIQTGRGTRQLDVHGNVSAARVYDGRGWALLETAARCEALLIDLESAQIQNAKPIGSGAFTDFVVCDGVLVASNGTELRSVNLL